jgi:hypothetical protein
MRDLGYSLETAIADLVDNSISAGADAIEIVVDAAGKMPVVVILDNGCGMAKPELLAAMRHGATNPRRLRTAVDLGRFGLGLKTASFSQSRSLTVVSVKEGEWCGAEWNLDRIDEMDDWVLAVLSEAEIKDLPYVGQLGMHGTAIVWRELDRLVEGDTSAPLDQVVNEKTELVARHLSLVFHRFLSGEARGFQKVSLSINRRSIDAFDPFCRKNPATQMLPEEIVRVNGKVVRLQPYILPHHSRLTATELDHYRDRSDFLSNQGVYVYRNSRLMAWGGWFRLVPKGEATKLARVQIDFPNSLDEAWTIDIKKSRAHPPWRVRERLRQIIEKIAQRSVDVHRKRGAKRFSETTAPFWERYADHSGIRYELNHEHPLVLSLARLLPPDSSGSLDMVLDAIAAALPVEMIYSDYATNPGKVEHRPVDKDTTLERLRDLHRVLCGDGAANADVFREVVRSTHLFDDNDELVEQFISGVYQ